MEPQIKRFVSQRLVGYDVDSEANTRTWWEATAELEDGSIQVVHLISERGKEYLDNWKVGACPTPPTPVRRT